MTPQARRRAKQRARDKAKRHLRALQVLAIAYEVESEHAAVMAGTGSYWPARLFIRECGGFDGDLAEQNVLAEVVRLALGGKP